MITIYQTISDSELSTLVAKHCAGWVPLKSDETDVKTDVWFNPNGGKTWRNKPIGAMQRGISSYATDLNLCISLKRKLLLELTSTREENWVVRLFEVDDDFTEEVAACVADTSARAVCFALLLATKNFKIGE